MPKEKPDTKVLTLGKNLGEPPILQKEFDRRMDAEQERWLDAMEAESKKLEDVEEVEPEDEEKTNGG